MSACAMQNTANCTFSTASCLPQDVPLFAAGNASNLTVLSDAGGYACARPLVQAGSSSDDGGLVLIGIGAGFTGFYVLLWACLWRKVPVLAMHREMQAPLAAASWHVWPRRVRSGRRALCHAPSFRPAATEEEAHATRLSWRARALLDANRLRALEDEAALRCVKHKADATDLAVLGRWEELVRLVQKEPASASTVGRFGYTALHHAARLGAAPYVLMALLDAAPSCAEVTTR